MKRFLLALGGLFCLHPGHGQTYTNKNSLFGLNVYVYDDLYGAGVSCFDADKDGLDDLTFCTDDQLLFYHNIGSGFQASTLNVEVNDNGKQPIWVDYDNDGDNDLFVTSAMDQCRLYRNDGNLQLTDVTDESGLGLYSVNHYGCSWADYDRDGDLDVYICTYVFLLPQGSDVLTWSDHLFRNNGDGTFTDVTMASGASDGISLSFQSAWLDYDKDLWPDLYVINDLLHPNRLYHNNGNGTFTEVGEVTGTSIASVDAMSASICDYNNDGWEDIFVSNVAIGDCVLLKNLGNGSFIDVAVSAGLDLQVLGWGGNWMDFNNDGYSDLYVCEYFPTTPGLPNPFLQNQGNGHFGDLTGSVFLFDFSDSYSCASGDWNNDGYPDLLVNNYEGQNANAWQSTGGNNHWIKCTLDGTVSNAGGVGTWMQVHSGNIHQYRYTRCGENYLGQKSDQQLFGIGMNAQVDSLLLTWPSGFTDSYYDLTPGQHYVFTEGETYAPLITASTTGICPGDTVILDAGVNQEVLWNTGASGQFLYVTEPGTYQAGVTNEFGITGLSNALFLDTIAVDAYSLSASPISCAGLTNGSLALWPTDHIAGTQWSNGTTGLTLEGIGAGTYSCLVLDSSGCSMNIPFILTEPEPLGVSVAVSDALCFGSATGNAAATGTGGTLPYAIDWLGIDPEALEAGSYQLILTDDMNCSIATEYSISSPEEMQVSFDYLFTCDEDLVQVNSTVTGGTMPYTFQWSDGGSTSATECLPCGSFVALEVSDVQGCHWSSGLSQLPCAVHTDLAGACTVWPVPAHDELHITGCPPGYTICLYSCTGEIMGTWSSSSTYLSLEAIPQGAYFIRLSGKNGDRCFPVVVY